MGILQRYILRELAYYFAILLALFVVVFTVDEMFDTKDEFFEYGPQLATVVQYILLTLPTRLVEAIPMISLFSALLATGLMARHREMIAMVASGASYGFLIVPVVLFGLALSVFSFLLSDSFAPRAMARAEYLYKVELKKENKFAVMSNDEIFRKGEGSRFYIMSQFDGVSKTMLRPSILDKSPNGGGLLQRIEAKSARLVESPETGKQSWEFKDAERWTFAEDGSISIEKFDQPLQLAMEEKLDSFLNREKKPEEMTLGELREHVSILDRQGLAGAATKYKTSVQSKLSAPFGCLFMAITAFTITADVRRRRFVVSVGIGLALAVGYFMVFQWMVSAGRSGAVSELVGASGPIVAAWSPVAFFAALSLFTFSRMSKVHP